MTRPSPTSRLCLFLLTLLAPMALAGTASAATLVPLGTTSSFAVLGGTTVTNTGPTIINGDLGISPGSACTGLPAPCTGGGPGIVNGTIHAADDTAAQAQLDLTGAYNNAAGQPAKATIGSELGGQVFPPGVYNSAAGDFAITGTVTLDGQGNPNAVFIFKTASTLVTAAGNSRVDLINGAQSCNVFWQVGSSATLGTNTLFRGNILALTAISATSGAVVDGRLLARNAAVTLDSNTVTRSVCAIAPTGPPVTVSKPPSNCTSRNFKMQVTVSDAAGISRTDVFLDGMRIKRSTKPSFSVTIKAKTLGPGRHKISVQARDGAGHTTNKKTSFQRCAPVNIGFTG
ncbi:MAG: hypothetical protein QOD60_1071 [Solirubrobacterales bacterium]|nr:hypothetical protein [Solirubrobacterales bacterium]